MFTQRKTDSYALIGTNARNSDCSIESCNVAKYGQQLIDRMSLEMSGKDRMSDNSRNSTPFAHPMNSNRTNSSGQFNADLVEGLLCAQMEVRPSNLSQMSDEKMLGALDALFTFGKSFLEQEGNVIEEEVSDFTQSKTNNSGSETSSKRGQFLISATNSDLEDILANEDDEAKIISKLMNQLSFLEEPLSKRFKPSCSQACIPAGDTTEDLPQL